MVQVVAPVELSADDEEDKGAFTAPGVNVNSDEFNGMSTDDAKKAITAKLESMDAGGAKITYKLRDWVFSRQRYWGEPIPIYFPVEFPT